MEINITYKPSYGQFQMPSCDLQSRFAKQGNKSTKTPWRFARVISNPQLKEQFKISDAIADPGKYLWHALTSDPTVHPFLPLKDGGVLQKPSAEGIALYIEPESCFKEF